MSRARASLANDARDLRNCCGETDVALLAKLSLPYCRAFKTAMSPTVVSSAIGSQHESLLLSNYYCSLLHPLLPWHLERPRQPYAVTAFPWRERVPMFREASCASL